MKLEEQQSQIEDLTEKLHRSLAAGKNFQRVGRKIYAAQAHCCAA